jgi:hypothetical protein
VQEVVPVVEVLALLAVMYLMTPQVMEALVLHGGLTEQLMLVAAAVAVTPEAPVLVVLAVAVAAVIRLTVLVQRVQVILVVAEVLALVALRRAVMVLVAVPVLLLFMYLQVVTQELKPVLRYQPVVVIQF